MGGGGGGVVGGIYICDIVNFNFSGDIIGVVWFFCLDNFMGIYINGFFW